jgi:agmatinase
MVASHHVEFYDTWLGFEPHVAAGGIATLSPLQVEDHDGESMSNSLYEVARQLLEKDKFVVTVAGEHTGIVGAVRAHAERYDDLTVVQLDAHSDLRPSYEGDPWSHASTAARILDFNKDLIQVGIRSQSKEERALTDEKGISVFFGDSIQKWDGDGLAWADDIVAATSSRVYVTLDCDVMDPSIMPATGTPEPGGLTWRQIMGLLTLLCSEREVVGLDVSELKPIPGIDHPQYIMAKLIYRMIGLVFESRGWSGKDV